MASALGFRGGARFARVVICAIFIMEELKVQNSLLLQLVSGL